MLSYAYWQRRFAGSPAVVGKQITVNNIPVTVIGVAQNGFLGSFLGVSTAAWLPMMPVTPAGALVQQRKPSGS